MLLADTPSVALGSAALVANNGFASANFRVSGGQLTPGPNTVTAVYGGDNSFSGSAAQIVINASLPTTNSAVVLSVTPNPVYQGTPDADGFSWFYTVRLSEAAGIGTTITDFTIDGQSYASQIFNWFGQANVPPSGRLMAVLRAKDVPVPSTKALSVSGMDPGGFTWTQQTTVYFVGPQITTYVTGVGNAASGRSVAAPGMLLRVSGSRLAPSAGGAVPAPWPLQLNGLAATVNGVAAPLGSVSANQVVLQVPYETAPGNAVLTLSSNGAVTSYSFVVTPAAPGIYGPAGSGSPGEQVSIFVTGDGLVMPTLADGATPDPSTPSNQLPMPQLPVTVSLANIPAAIQFVGIPSGMVGETRVDFVVPQNAPLGAQPLVVTVGAVASPAVAFTVTQQGSQ